MRRILAVIVAAALVALTAAATAQAVSVSGAKIAMRNFIVRNYYVQYGSLHFYSCGYRGSRNRVQCSFDYYDTDDNAEYCANVRVSFKGGYRYIRTFGFVNCDGE